MSPRVPPPRSARSPGRPRFVCVAVLVAVPALLAACGSAEDPSGPGDAGFEDASPAGDASIDARATDAQPASDGDASATPDATIDAPLLDGAVDAPADVSPDSPASDGGLDAALDAGPCLSSCADTVATAAPMAQGRSGHASVALPDGTVMVMGGIPSSATGPRYEVFDPKTGKWSVPVMTGAPSYPGNVAYLRSGGDVVTGQTTYATNLSFFDPTAGTWKEGAYPLLTSTDPFSAVLATGHAVVGGGWKTGGYTQSQIYGYDPAANTWKSGGLNEPRRSALAAPGTPGHALVVGGRNGLSDLFSAELVDAVTAVARYTGSPHSWSLGAASVTLKNGDVLWAGGDDGKTEVSRVERWSAATGKWSRVMSLVTPRKDTTLVRLDDGRVLAIGGRTRGGAAVGSVEAFDPKAGRWQTVGALATPRYQHSVALMGDGRVLVTGGVSGAALDVASVEIVDPSKSCARAGATVCACEGEPDAVLCERYEARCGVPTLVDRCGKARSVSCAAAACDTTESCEIAADGSSGCTWTAPLGSRFRVEPLGYSNYYQGIVAIGGDAASQPTMVLQGTPLGVVSGEAVCLTTRGPSGAWLREGVAPSASALRVSAAFYEGRAPRVLVAPGSLDTFSLYRWETNVWNPLLVPGLFATRITGRALVVDSGDRASLAWVRQPFAGTQYDVGFTVVEPSIATTPVDSITGSSEIGAVLDASGTPHLAYADTSLGVKYATRPSAAWTTEIVDPAGGLGARIFVDRAGAVHLVYRAKTSAHIVKHATRGAAGWVVDEWPLSTPDAYNPVFEVGSDGKVHVAWSSKAKNSILYAVRGVSSWAEEIVYTPAGPTDALAMAGMSLTKDGRPRPRLAFRLGGSAYYATTR